MTSRTSKSGEATAVDIELMNLFSEMDKLEITVELELMNLFSEMDKLEIKFDLEFCYQWLDHVHECVKEVSD